MVDLRYLPNRFQYDVAQLLVPQKASTGSRHLTADRLSVVSTSLVGRILSPLLFAAPISTAVAIRPIQCFCQFQGVCADAGTHCPESGWKHLRQVRRPGGSASNW